MYQKSTSHNILIPYIHNTLACNVILDKRCIKFLWTLFNSGYDIYRTIIKYSLHNRNTTLGENVRYFMHKYNIVFTDWFENIDILYNKIDMYVKHVTAVAHSSLIEVNCYKYWMSYVPNDFI